MTIVMGVLVVACLAAIVSRLRLHYYVRRNDNAIQQELALQSELNRARAEGEHLFWEGS